MGMLKNILEEAFFLKEDASVDSINDAIRNMRPVRITYYGPSGTGTGEREIYPVAYGLSTAGNPVVRAFQPQGSTSSSVPAWKFFRLDRIKSWDNDTSRTFDPRDLNGFNENGDEQIETLYAIAPIANVPVEKTPPAKNEPEKTLTSHPVSKGEVQNGGADKDTEREYYTANDAVRDVLSTSNAKIAPVSNKNIDNVTGQNYNSDENPPARDPIPVTKGEVGGPAAVNGPEERDATLYADNEPVMKSDLGTGRGTPENGGTTIRDTFKDLNDRWDNLDKEEEL